MEPIDVVRAHLAAVRSGDPSAMAADYAPAAVLERPDATYRGAAAIAGYFATVEARLGGGRVMFDEPHLEGDGTILVAWRLHDGPGHGVSGRDRYVVVDGAIVRQTVELDGDDF